MSKRVNNKKGNRSRRPASNKQNPTTSRAASAHVTRKTFLAADPFRLGKFFQHLVGAIK